MIAVDGQQTPRAHGEQDEVGGGETPFDRVAHERPYYGAVIGSKPCFAVQQPSHPSAQSTMDG